MARELKELGLQYAKADKLLLCFSMRDADINNS